MRVGAPVDAGDTRAMGGMGMSWMLLSGLAALALLVLAVVGTVWLARRPRRSRQSDRPESSEDVLRRRYVAGELDEDEYLRRRADIRND